jgi:hypothetical protein
MAEAMDNLKRAAETFPKARLVLAEVSRSRGVLASAAGPAALTTDR